MGDFGGEAPSRLRGAQVLEAAREMLPFYSAVGAEKGVWQRVGTGDKGLGDAGVTGRRDGCPRRRGPPEKRPGAPRFRPPPPARDSRNSSPRPCPSLRAVLGERRCQTGGASVLAALAVTRSPSELRCAHSPPPGARSVLRPRAEWKETVAEGDVQECRSDEEGTGSGFTGGGGARTGSRVLSPT